MSEYPPGSRVRVRLDDPLVHTRAPRYVRGHEGTVVETHGSHPLPDDVVAGRPPSVEPVYAVRFEAGELWGEGNHSVTVNLWESYLQAPPERERAR